MAYVYQRNGKWRIQYRDEHRKLQDVKGFSTKKASILEGTRLEDQVTQIKRGTLNKNQAAITAAASLPLTRHLEDWRKDVIAGGSSVEHADLIHYRVSRVMELGNNGRGYTLISQIELLEVQGIIKQLMDDGLSQQTANHVVQSCRQFSLWLKTHHRAAEYVLAKLKKYAVTEIARNRVNLIWEDVAAMIQWLETSKPQQGGQFRVPAKDRAMMYRVTAATGLRRRAICSLTPESFDLTKGAPTVTVLPGYSKNKKAITLPLPDDLGILLAAYLKDKPAGKVLWNLSDRTGNMIRRDFLAAGIKFPEDNYDRDFHCLRHTYITSLIDAGTDLKTVQEMAGHSVITLTAKYAHTTRDKKRTAVNALPPIPPAAPPTPPQANPPDG